MAEIEDLFVLLGPFEDKINDPLKIEEINFAYKKKQLQEAEKIDKTEILGKMKTSQRGLWGLNQGSKSIQISKFFHDVN